MILLFPFLMVAMFAVGAGRIGIVVAPIVTGVAFFHDKIFAGVDVSPTGLYGGVSPLAALAQTNWTMFAILSWGMVLSWLMLRALGVRNRLIDGFLFD
ncbi:MULTISPECIES: hypothetical protein [Burkholderia cepacia complex]|uniref:Uncharacterized protein n=1 Tax=Burkholderia pseudomultivorans TaxID=1207504 RepID=A0A132EMN7_9BURK|nr:MULTISPECIES: hypothetical protein [Burkholderia cepacia complex]KWE97879.1 hypothetical protein WL81_02280 [Burkholderia ubonensis]KWF37434.1 hypothetical protein WT56_34405 [Burkholderia pseudomultivorans]